MLYYCNIVMTILISVCIAMLPLPLLSRMAPLVLFVDQHRNMLTWVVKSWSSVARRLKLSAPLSPSIKSC